MSSAVIDDIAMCDKTNITKEKTKWTFQVFKVFITLS